MGKSIYSNISYIAKKILGIKDFSLWRKNIHKKLGKLIYHKKYTSEDLIDLLKSMGVQRGSIVCVHSSMKEFYNYNGSAEDLIRDLIEYLGPSGTLVMPAFPKVPGGDYSNFIFNPRTAQTGAGFLAEAFRNYPNVQRSNNVQHSVCAIGKYADQLLKDHVSGTDCWDKSSPWYKMCELNALVINLGMPRWYIGTFHHCVESLLKNEHPYWSQFFNKKQIYKYIDQDGKIQSYTNLTCSIVRRTREKRVTKYFTSEHWSIAKISNLEVKLFRSGKCLDKMLELGRKGITVYYEPSPSKFEFPDA